MASPIKIDFDRKPSVAWYMAKAFLPSKGLKRMPVPEFHMTWTGVLVDQKTLNRFLNLVEMQKGETVPIIFPQVVSFPLVMSLVTHPQFPEPIWNALQVRNVMTQFKKIKVGEVIDFDLRTCGQRILEKGAEVELKMTAKVEGEIAWEGLTTFYYRGRFGSPESPAANSQPPEIKPEKTIEWKMPTGGGAAYGDLSGDYNGIHLWTLYAKLFGFKKAFLHPHRPVGEVLAHIQNRMGAGPRKLSLWFRGPVPYGATVQLNVGRQESKTVFGLHLKGDARSCIVGLIE